MRYKYIHRIWVGFTLVYWECSRNVLVLVVTSQHNSHSLVNTRDVHTSSEHRACAPVGSFTGKNGYNTGKVRQLSLSIFSIIKKKSGYVMTLNSVLRHHFCYLECSVKQGTYSCWGHKGAK